MQSLNTIITAPLRLLGEYEIEVVVISGVGATLFGSTQLTNDLDVCYARNSKNLEKLANALESVTLICGASRTTFPSFLTLKRFAKD